MRIAFRAGFCFLLTATAAFPGSRPNVLFIAVDDLRVELNCYGQQHVISPNIDRLASEGMLFERAYCQQTVCNPSRASVLTGMRPDTLRVWDLPTHFRVHHPDAVTLPQLLMRNGYFTRCIGKIFHNWRQDEWKGDPSSWSVPAELHYNSHGKDAAVVSGPLPPNNASGRGGLECRDVPDNAYYDGRVADSAVSAIHALAQENRPWFLAVGFWKPHTPFNAPKKYWDLYEREQLPIPKSTGLPRDVPEIALTKDRVPADMPESHLRELHHGHVAAISYLDAQVGRVLSALREAEKDNETVVVFWSDHGLHLGEHGLTRKTTVFELDAAVPFIIRSPNSGGGLRSRSLVELVDLYPTIAELCGLNVPDSAEGLSLVSILNDPVLQLRSSALTQAPRPNYLRGNVPQVMGYSIRTDRFRYTEWKQHESGLVQDRELYDHDRDPSENVNVVGKPEFATLVEQLSEELQGRIGDR